MSHRRDDREDGDGRDHDETDERADRTDKRADETGGSTDRTDKSADGTDERADWDRTVEHTPNVESTDVGDGTEQSSGEGSTKTERSADRREAGGQTIDRESPGPREDETAGRTREGPRVGPASSRRPEIGGTDRAPPRNRSSSDEDSRWRRLLRYGVDIASSVAIVGLIGALLFATSGVWPPLVAVESPSMEPHIDTGDLVFVMDEHRFAGAGAIGDSGVVPARAGEQTGYRTFEGYGDVIIYEPDGDSSATPIIHRAMFWVEAGENWCQPAEESHLGGLEPTSERCVADHAGFVTKGDNNDRYDQVMGISDPVKPEWVIGTAEYSVPGLGQVRLRTGDVGSTVSPLAPPLLGVNAMSSLVAN